MISFCFTKSFSARLQEVNLVLEVLGWWLMQKFARQQCQLMGVLHNSWNTHSSAPVVVEMAHLVGHYLKTIRRQSAGVIDDVVASWCNRSLTHCLADEIEVVAEKNL